MGQCRPKNSDLALQLGTVSKLFSCLMNEFGLSLVTMQYRNLKSERSGWSTEGKVEATIKC